MCVLVEIIMDSFLHIVHAWRRLQTLLVYISLNNTCSIVSAVIQWAVYIIRGSSIIHSSSERQMKASVHVRGCVWIGYWRWCPQRGTFRMPLTLTFGSPKETTLTSQTHTCSLCTVVSMWIKVLTKHFCCSALIDLEQRNRGGRQTVQLTQRQRERQKQKLERKLLTQKRRKTDRDCPLFRSGNRIMFSWKIWWVKLWRRHKRAHSHLHSSQFI